MLEMRLKGFDMTTYITTDTHSFSRSPPLGMLERLSVIYMILKQFLPIVCGADYLWYPNCLIIQERILACFLLASYKLSNRRALFDFGMCKLFV